MSTETGTGRKPRNKFRGKGGRGGSRSKTFEGKRFFNRPIKATSITFSYEGDDDLLINISSELITQIRETKKLTIEYLYAFSHDNRLSYLLFLENGYLLTGEWGRSKTDDLDWLFGETKIFENAMAKGVGGSTLSELLKHFETGSEKPMVIVPQTEAIQSISIAAAHLTKLNTEQWDDIIRSEDLLAAAGWFVMKDFEAIPIEKKLVEIKRGLPDIDITDFIPEKDRQFILDAVQSSGVISNLANISQKEIWGMVSDLYLKPEKVIDEAPEDIFAILSQVSKPSGSVLKRDLNLFASGRASSFINGISVQQSIWLGNYQWFLLTNGYQADLTFEEALKGEMIGVFQTPIGEIVEELELLAREAKPMPKGLILRAQSYKFTRLLIQQSELGKLAELGDTRSWVLPVTIKSSTI